MTMISAWRLQAFPVTSRVLLVLRCGIQWYRKLFATPVLAGLPFLGGPPADLG